MQDVAAMACLAQHGLQSRRDISTITQELTLAWSHTWVMPSANQGALAAYMVFWQVAQEVQLHDLVVAVGLRRQGRAHGMLVALLDYCAVRAVDRVSLEVRRSNMAAQALYRHFGFEVVGRRPAYYTAPVEDAVLMERTC